jgi:hypothetical protein
MQRSEHKKQALTQEERTLHMETSYSKPMNNGSRFPRRTLITTAAVVGIGGVAIAAPRVAPVVEQHLEQAAIGELEGVSIDAALKAAEITRAAVEILVVPIARLAADLGGGALGLLLDSLGVAHNALAFVHASTATVDQLRKVIASWRAGVNGLPIALNTYATADIASAETYLRALKKTVQQQ